MALHEKKKLNKIKSNDNLNELIHFVILFMGHALTFTLFSGLQQTVESTHKSLDFCRKIKEKKKMNKTENTMK